MKYIMMLIMLFVVLGCAAITATKEYVDRATNETLRAANAYTDAHAGGGGVSTNDVLALIEPATNAIYNAAVVEAADYTDTKIIDAYDYTDQQLQNYQPLMSGGDNIEIRADWSINATGLVNAATLVSATNETLRAANAYTDAHAGGGGVSTNDVRGIIANDTALAARLNAKQDALTAGDNISITTNNVIKVSGLPKFDDLAAVAQAATNYTDNAAQAATNYTDAAVTNGRWIKTKYDTPKSLKNLFVTTHYDYDGYDDVINPPVTNLFYWGFASLYCEDGSSGSIVGIADINTAANLYYNGIEIYKRGWASSKMIEFPFDEFDDTSRNGTFATREWVAANVPSEARVAALEAAINGVAATLTAALEGGE